jgi:glycosyltransferase involved in cell wall biosynthesis
VTTRLGVVVLARPENGGTYQYTLSMLQALRHTSGFDVTLYGDPTDPELIKAGYPIVAFSESRQRQLSALAADRLGVKLTDPFASEDLLLAPIYSLALLHTAKPFAYTLHDLQEKHYPGNFSIWQRTWRHQIHARLLRRARRVICESSYVKTDIFRHFGVDERRIAVIAAPPQSQFQSGMDAQQLEAARERIGLPARFLFYPAQFWPHKNHMRLVEAFRGVVDEIGDLGLVLTGKKRDDYQAVMDAVARLGLTEKVHHLGYVEQRDLQAAYQLATALVMPSLFESVSIPIYEAFQVGTPVIASNVVAIPEQVGDAGALFDPTSVASMRDAILDVVSNPDVARRHAAIGRERMQSMTRERYGSQLQALLFAMAAEPSVNLKSGQSA